MLLWFFPILSIISQIVPVVTATRKFRLLPRELKVLSWYFYLSILSGALQIILALNSTRNLWVSQGWVPVQFALVMYPLAVWQPERGLRRAALLSIPLYVIAWGIVLARLGDMTAMSTYMRPVAGVVLIGVSIVLLVRVLVNERLPAVEQAQFWTATATLMYFGGTIVFYAMIPLLLTLSLQQMRVAWSSQSVLNVIANLLYAKAFLCVNRRPN